VTLPEKTSCLTRPRTSANEHPQSDVRSGPCSSGLRFRFGLPHGRPFRALHVHYARRLFLGAGLVSSSTIHPTGGIGPDRITSSSP